MTQSRTTTHEQAGVGLGEYLSNILLAMTFGLAITAGLSWYISHVPSAMEALFHLVPGVNKDGEAIMVPAMSGWWIASAVGQLAIVITISWFGVGRSSGTPIAVSSTLFGVFAALNGVTLAPMLYAYTDVSIVKVALITAATFGGAALWGKTTKVDLRPFGTFFLMALVGLLIVLVVNMFFSSPLMDYIVSGVAVLLFAGLTAYDIQKLQDYHDPFASGGGPVIYGALVLYLDALNLFIHLMRLFGQRK